MKTFAALLIGPVMASLVIFGILLMTPSLGEAYFGLVWEAMTLIVLVLCLAFIVVAMDEREGLASPGRAP